MRRRLVVALLSLLILFCIISLFGLFHLRQGTAIFPIGISAYADNMIVIILSTIAMVKVVIEMIRIGQAY